jgi:FAD/FMN-containing dehydrogenase
LTANVASLEVVTGDGSLERCSRSERRDPYDAVIGALACCGVIVSAELELRSVARDVAPLRDALLWGDRLRRVACSPPRFRRL